MEFKTPIMRRAMKSTVWIFVFMLIASCNYKTYKNGYGPDDENPPAAKPPVQQPTPEPNPNPVPSQDGKTLFAKKCASCHSEASLSGITVQDVKTALLRISAMRSVVVNDTQIASIVSSLGSNQNPNPGNPNPGNPGTGNPGGGDDEGGDD
jgi:cytochrome c5